MNDTRISFAHHLLIKLHTTIAEICRAPCSKQCTYIECKLVEEAMHHLDFPCIFYLERKKDGA